jgi:hypothetical protein
MKLRLQSNTIRLRLKRGEVDQLTKTGCVEEKIIMGNNPEDIFHYVLESSRVVSALQVAATKRGVLVQVPADSVLNWASGNDVGIETTLAVGEGKKLQVLIEKDFACLNGNEEQNVDTFPNPLAGAKC